MFYDYADGQAVVINYQTGMYYGMSLLGSAIGLLWARKADVDGRVIDFIQENQIWLDKDPDAKEGEDTGLDKTPDRRGWKRVSDIIKQAGGLTNRAYAEGTKLLRQMTQEERDMMETVLRTAQRNSGKDSIDVRKLLTNEGL